MDSCSIDMILGFRIDISSEGRTGSELGLQVIIGIIFQLVLFGGVGGVILVNYAMKGIILGEGAHNVTKLEFTSDYDELMWLEEKQKVGATEAETLRFYELRDHWTDMHADRPLKEDLSAKSHSDSSGLTLLRVDET